MRPVDTRTPPARSACAWRRRVPAPPTWSRRWPTRTWTRSRSSRSPVRSAAALIGTDAFQEADISGITMPITKHNFLVRDGDDIPRVMAEAFHIARPGRPGPVLVDIPKDVLQGAVHVQLAAADRAARLQAEHQAAQPPDPRGRQAHRRGPQAGALRRRRRHPRRRHRGAAGSGRADRHPGGHHADGARRLPGQPPAEPGHAGHARHGRRGGRAAAQRSADRARHPVRRPGDGQAGLVRARGQGHSRRHRPGRDRQEPPRRRADRGRRQGRHRRPDRGAAPRRHGRRAPSRWTTGGSTCAACSRRTR